MSHSKPRLLDVEDDDDKGIWVARVESLSVSQVNEFKKFVKRRNGSFLASRLFPSSPIVRSLRKGPVERANVQLFTTTDMDAHGTIEK
jgi:hypothetical protein